LSSEIVGLQCTIPCSRRGFARELLGSAAVVVVRRLALLFCAALVFGGASMPASGQGLSGQRAQAARLKAAVAAQERRIADTRDGLAQAQARLAQLQARATRRQTQLDDTQTKLVRARVHLTTLERKEARASTLLAANLVSAYKGGTPTFVSVVMDANGFADLLERLDFVKRVARRNASILDITRAARAATQKQARDLKGLRNRYSVLAKAAVDDRDEAYVVKSALLRREESQLRVRDGVATRLVAVRGRIARLERAQAAAARAARNAASVTTQAPRTFSGGGGGGGSGGGGGGGGDVVGRVVAAANEIATTPYVWGGGHGGASGGYDCSGSISYALAAGGLLSSPLDSTGFMSWGDAGPGRRITVYANAGHAFMIVDGRRYDTGALSGGGTRWTSAMRSTAGFVARHPPGL
jgi:cell wall-associated NlpC family hydrolase